MRIIILTGVTYIFVSMLFVLVTPAPLITINNLKTFFTLDNLIWFQGAAVVSVVIPNTLGLLLGYRFNKWKSTVAVIIVFIWTFLFITLAQIKQANIYKPTIAFFYFLLMFFVAIGVNQIFWRSRRGKPKAADIGRRFFTDWLENLGEDSDNTEHQNHSVERSLQGDTEDKSSGDSKQ